MTARASNPKRNKLNTIESFLNKISINSDNGCWEWSGYVNVDGYGRISISAQMHLVHRVSYLFHKGDIGNFYVLHTCDNPKCCNPDHLFLGTHEDNMADRARKKKSKLGNKLSKLEVKEIRNILLNGNTTQVRLAQQYRVSQSSISQISTHKAWRNI